MKNYRTLIVIITGQGVGAPLAKQIIFLVLMIVRVSLGVQNCCVALCAVVISVLLAKEDYFFNSLSSIQGRYALEAIVIALAIIASLASVAYKVSIGKDWIVIVAGGDKENLANLNAVTRAIDLACKTLSTFFVGLVMSFASRLTAAIFIAVWNVVSLGLEYALLMRVYALVPRLAYKETAKDKETQKEDDDETQNTTTKTDKYDPIRASEQADIPEEVCPSSEVRSEVSMTLTDESFKSPETESLTKPGVVKDSKKGGDKKDGSDKAKGQNKTNILRLLFGPFITLAQGWRTYVRHRVLFAGVALGCLYMTVLGFDSITVGYIFAQGVSETILGVCSALAGTTGIIGTFIYTRLWRRIGLNKTGVFGFSFEVLCLCLAVASVWAPGSPYGIKDYLTNNCTQSTNTSLTTDEQGSQINSTDAAFRGKREVIHEDLNPVLFPFILSENRIHHQSALQDRGWPRLKRDVQNININTSDQFMPYRVLETNKTITGQEKEFGEMTCKNGEVPKISVVLFLIGIILSRIGLWIADLSVTQVFQENAEEWERGVLGGVQNSVNTLLDTLKFVLVILLPDIHTFGILILLSFVFINLGLFSFIGYVGKENGFCRSKAPSRGRDKPEVNIIYKPSAPNYKPSQTA